MTQPMAVQAATKACEQVLVVPRARRRARGATTDKISEASASGNRHRSGIARAVSGVSGKMTASGAKSPSAKKRGAAKPRRPSFITVGPPEDRVTFRFPAGTPVPCLITKARPRDVESGKCRIVEGYRLVYGPKKGTRPNSLAEPLPLLTTREARRAWVRTLPKVKIIPEPEPGPVPEQWFRIVVPEVAMQDPYWDDEAHHWDKTAPSPPDARNEFPHGWCAELVSPQPEKVATYDRDNGWVFAKPDPSYYYVGLPLHYESWNLREERFVQKTDSADGHGKVEYGMWMPRWLLRPVSLDEASRIYDTVRIQAICGYDRIEEAERHYDFLAAQSRESLEEFFEIAPAISKLARDHKISFHEAHITYLKG